MQTIPKQLMGGGEANVARVVSLLRKMLGAGSGRSRQKMSKPSGPDDLPELSPNATSSDKYRAEGLRDPGIIGGVTGTGGGPVL